MTSIRQHLTRIMAVGFGLLIVASGSAIYLVTRVALLSEFDAGLRSKALALSTQIEQNSSGFQVEFSPAVQQEFHNAAVPQYFQIWRTNGLSFSQSEDLHGVNLPYHFGSQASPALWNLKLPGDLSGRAVGIKFRPKMEDEDQRQTLPVEAILVVAVDRRPLDRTLTTLAAVLIATGLLALVATIPTVKFSVRRGHASLEKLGWQASEITADTLQARFAVATLPEELQPITARLNDLLKRLETSFERERRFSADLAHELRTPLAELRTHAEVGLQFPDGPGAESYHETLGIALQMEAIVTRLLDLARYENGRIPLQIASLPIAVLVEEVWRPFTRPAAEKQLTIQMEIPGHAETQTDATLFRSILANLFSNAVAYTPHDGTVEVRWRSETRELTVSNTVHDLKPDDIPHLFERLWRKDKSRTGAEHHGLGLALSRAFASALGLTLTAQFTNETTLALTLKPADLNLNPGTLQRNIPATD